MSMFETYPRITPFLWFDGNAEEAVDFYLTVFKNARKLEEFRTPVETQGGGKGSVITVSFELEAA